MSIRRWLLPRRPGVAALARRHVAQACVGEHGEVREVAQLLTSELVSNAVAHGAGEIALVLEEQPERLRIAVHDDAPSQPVPRQPDTGSERGRGLMLVAALAAAWGSDRLATGKRVWFELHRLPALVASDRRAARD